MAIIISGINPSAQDETTPSKLGYTDSLNPKTSKTTEENQKADAVDLSSRAKAIMLSHEGSSIPEIAVIMNLDTKTVASYLGLVTVNTQTAQAVLPDTHAPATLQQPFSSDKASYGSSKPTPASRD